MPAMVLASAAPRGPTTMVTTALPAVRAKMALVMPWFSVGGMMAFQSSGTETV